MINTKYFRTIVAGSMTLTALASSAPVWAQSLDLASATAKTVQVKTAQWEVPYTKPGEPRKPIHVISNQVILYNRAGGCRIDNLGTLEFPATDKPCYLVNDGKVQYEVDGMDNYYTDAALPLASGLRSRIGFTDEGSALALNWKWAHLERYTPAPDETVDGKKLKVYIYEHTQRMPKFELNFQQKLWVDADTRLPIRYSEFTREGGAAEETRRTTFSDWNLNVPIDPAKFVWTSPAGVKESIAPIHVEMLPIGSVAPEFVASKWGGGDLKLSDYRGKIVVIDFWATWCGPCQVLMPHMESMYQSVKDKNVAVIGLCVSDTQEAYEKWMEAAKGVYNYTFAYDPAGKSPNNRIGSLYKTKYIPTTYVIDKNGKVAAAIVSTDTYELEEALEKLGVKISFKKGKTVATKSE